MKRVLAGVGVAGLAAMAMLGCSHGGDQDGEAG